MPSPDIHPRILITGAKGNIGSILVNALKERNTVFQLDKVHCANSATEANVDISDFAAVTGTFEKFKPLDAVIHLAGNPDPDASWEKILLANIIGTRNIYEAARQHNVPRVVFASSTHLQGAYEGYPSASPLGRPITAVDPIRPDSDYGLSKAFGEQLARQYYDLHRIESICLRIGNVTQDNNPTPMHEKFWLSHRDLVQLFSLALNSDIPFGIYYAISDNHNPVFDISQTKQDLGYSPQDGV